MSWVTAGQESSLPPVGNQTEALIRMYFVLPVMYACRGQTPGSWICRGCVFSFISQQLGLGVHLLLSHYCITSGWATETSCIITNWDRINWFLNRKSLKCIYEVICGDSETISKSAKLFSTVFWSPFTLGKNPTNTQQLASVGKGTIGIYSRVIWLCSSHGYVRLQLRSAVMETWHLMDMRIFTAFPTRCYDTPCRLCR